MKFIFRFLIFLLLIPLGCIDEFLLELPFTEPKLVADVLISSKPGESSITIGWTYPSGSGCFYEDSFGRYAIPCEPDNAAGPYKVNGRIVLTEIESGNSYEFPVRMAERKSFISMRPEITGTPGNNYTLDIEISYNNITSNYHSKTHMRATPAIDQMSYEIRKGDVGKSDNFVPLIYFTEPQDEKNYYMFQICEAHQNGSTMYCGHSRVWSYSIISDDFLPENVNGLSIDDGATVAKYAEFYPQVYPGVGAQVRMYSVSRDTYEFYKALLNQFNNDGGAYSPTPASPSGNISGDAIGLFRALDESTGTVYL